MNDRWHTDPYPSDPYPYPPVASEASGVASTEPPSYPLANPTDAVAEAARRVHEGEAQAIEAAVTKLIESAEEIISNSESHLALLQNSLHTHSKELLQAVEALRKDTQEFSETLHREGKAILSDIQAKTAHVLACSASIRYHLSTPHQES